MGMNGSDFLNGGRGNDVLDGENLLSYSGIVDTLTGGTGVDKFILGVASNNENFNSYYAIVVGVLS